MYLLVQIFFTFNRTDVSLFTQVKASVWKNNTLYKAQRKSESSFPPFIH